MNKFKRWLCLLLVSAFMLQSVAAGVGMLDYSHSVPGHQMASLDNGHSANDTNLAMQDCDMHEHGHCCNGHFSAVLNHQTFEFHSASNQVTVHYSFLIPSPPSDELLRPPTV